jgi:hypothetical protein
VSDIDLAADVAKAARKAAYGWPEMVDADDVEQEIWVRLLESPGRAQLARRLPEDERVGLLTMIGRQASSDLRDDYDHFHGNYFYDRQEVVQHLENGALTNDTPCDDPEILDITEAMSGIRDRHQILIRKRFVFGEFVGKTDKDALGRAVTSLTRQMNRIHRNRQLPYEQGPGTRRVLSNGHARVITERQ